MLSKFVNELKKRHKEQEQKRIGDIYAECIDRGCKESFLKAFDGRIWVYPVEQTYTFLDSNDNSEHLRQWKLYLQVVLEKRPDHEKADEWKEALRLLETNKISERS